MLHVSFNQDFTCFACALEGGFAVYNCDPPTQRFSRISTNSTEPSGIGIVEMLFRSNIFALVGGGTNPKYPPNTLMIWDDFQSKCIAKMEFKTPVTGVKLRRDLILVSTIDKSYLYRFSDLQLTKRYDTFSNSTGAASITHGENTVVAVPGNVAGSVIVDNVTTGLQHILTAHTNPISALALNIDGSQLATASTRGTIIRIWDTKTGNKIREFRRGLEVVSITSLTFDLDSTKIIVCSSKGTAHVFNLKNKDDNLNRKSTLSYISDYLPSYFSSEWSSVAFEVPAGSICSFGNNNIYVITPDSKFLNYTCTTGQCKDSVDIEKLNTT